MIVNSNSTSRAWINRRLWRPWPLVPSNLALNRVLQGPDTQRLVFSSSFALLISQRDLPTKIRYQQILCHSLYPVLTHFLNFFILSLIKSRMVSNKSHCTLCANRDRFLICQGIPCQIPYLWLPRYISRQSQIRGDLEKIVRWGQKCPPTAKFELKSCQIWEKNEVKFVKFSETKLSWGETGFGQKAGMTISWWVEFSLPGGDPLSHRGKKKPARNIIIYTAFTLGQKLSSTSIRSSSISVLW